MRAPRIQAASRGRPLHPARGASPRDPSSVSTRRDPAQHRRPAIPAALPIAGGLSRFRRTKKCVARKLPRTPQPAQDQDHTRNIHQARRLQGQKHAPELRNPPTRPASDSQHSARPPAHAKPRAQSRPDHQRTQAHNRHAHKADRTCERKSTRTRRRVNTVGTTPTRARASPTASLETICSTENEKRGFSRFRGFSRHGISQNRIYGTGAAPHGSFLARLAHADRSGAKRAGTPKESAQPSRTAFIFPAPRRRRRRRRASLRPYNVDVMQSAPRDPPAGSIPQRRLHHPALASSAGFFA